MFAVNGYCDGMDIKLLEKIAAKPKQKVLTTFVDEHGNIIMKINREIKDHEEVAKKLMNCLEYCQNILILN